MKKIGKTETRYLTESALMIALGTVLSMLKFGGFWAFGGGVTFCSMLPMVLISYRWGVNRGLMASTVYAAIQMLLGIDNIQYATSIWMAAGIILLDYLVAYGVLGFSGIFRNRIKDPRLALVAGIGLTFFLRFLCHFVTGWMIWDALWPNEFGMLPAIYSLYYNGSYMLPEFLITSAVVTAFYNPLKKYLE